MIMDILEYDDANEIFQKAINLKEYNGYFAQLSTAVYEGTKRIESNQCEYAVDAVKPEDLMNGIAFDMKQSIQTLNHQPWIAGQTTDENIKLITQFATEMTKKCIKAGKFLGDGDVLRQNITLNAVVAIAKAHKIG